MSRRIHFTLLSLLVLATLAVRAEAHVGGHDLPVGTALHVWIDPTTAEGVPGSLLFVSAGAAHVEDIAGRVHAWPVGSLNRADRALVDTFSARTARLNGISPEATESPLAPVAWLGVLACLAGVLLIRAGVSAGTVARLGVLSLADVARQETDRRQVVKSATKCHAAVVVDPSWASRGTEVRRSACWGSASNQNAVAKRPRPCCENLRRSAVLASSFSSPAFPRRGLTK